MSNYWPRHVYARAFILESLKDQPRPVDGLVGCAKQRDTATRRSSWCEEARKHRRHREGDRRQAVLGPPAKSSCYWWGRSPGTYNPQQKKAGGADEYDGP